MKQTWLGLALGPTYVRAIRHCYVSLLQQPQLAFSITLCWQMHIIMQMWVNNFRFSVFFTTMLINMETDVLFNIIAHDMWQCWSYQADRETRVTPSSRVKLTTQFIYQSWRRQMVCSVATDAGRCTQYSNKVLSPQTQYAVAVRSTAIQFCRHRRSTQYAVRSTAIQSFLCVTSGCRRGLNEFCALLWCYTAQTGSYAPMCRNYLTLEDRTNGVSRNVGK